MPAEVDLLRRRRQAEQIEAEASQQGHAVGFGSRQEFLPVEPGENEGVDRIAEPCGVVHLRKLRSHDWLEGPVVAAPPTADDLFVGRELGSLGDPFLDQRDLGRLQRRLLVGHPFDVVGAGEDLEQQAFLGLPRHDPSTSVTAPGGQPPGIGPETRHDLLRPVTTVAVSGQQRLDLFPVVDLRWCGVGRRGHVPRHAQEQQEQGGRAWHGEWHPGV